MYTTRTRKPNYGHLSDANFNHHSHTSSYSQIPFHDSKLVSACTDTHFFFHLPFRILCHWEQERLLIWELAPGDTDSLRNELQPRKGAKFVERKAGSNVRHFGVLQWTAGWLQGMAYIPSASQCPQQNGDLWKSNTRDAWRVTHETWRALSK